jgi:hypothetical protein
MRKAVLSALQYDDTTRNIACLLYPGVVNIQTNPFANDSN